MPNIFTRPAIDTILNNEELTVEQRREKIFALYGQALDDGFVSRTAAEESKNKAIEAAKAEWEKNQQKPDILNSPEYLQLKGEFDAYKDKETARNSDDFKGVKSKYFDAVYGKIDRSEGAKPVSEQIAAIKQDFEEMFEPAAPKPSFGAPTGGTMPKGDEGAVSAFTSAWGLPKHNDK